MGTYTLIKCSIENAVAVLTLNNPPVNTLSTKVIEEVKACLAALAEDDAVRALVITGEGDKAFMAGADIKEMPPILEGGKESAVAYAQNGHSMFDCVAQFIKPTIAAVNGFALGGGCELALACDIRICCDTALFGLPEIKLGIIPGGGGTQRLHRLIGEARAKELIFTGDPIKADKAYELGLVNKVVSPENVLSEAVSMAEKIAGRPACAVRAAKCCINKGGALPIADGLKVEIDEFGKLFQSRDAEIGINAFIEKKKPEFKHC